MDRTFILEQLTDDGSNIVAQLVADYYTIGRDDEESNIVINSSSVSRRHAIISCCGSMWLYQDVGSTNGSWINDVQLDPNKWYLLRPSDNLMIADLSFRLSEISSEGKRVPLQAKRSLIVLKNDLFLSEIPVPEYGRALTIGGVASDFELEGDLFEQPSLVVERHGEVFVLYSVAKEYPLSLNGVDIRDVAELKDCDEIELMNYKIFYSDPDLHRDLEAGQINDASQLSLNLKDWGASADDWKLSQLTGSQSGLFGKKVDDSDADGTATFEVNVASRRKIPTEVEDTEIASMEDKVVLIIGIVLVVLLLAVVSLWFML